MKYLLTLLLIISLVSCAREVPPTVENINKIFESKDFTFEYHDKAGSCQSLSFRHDYLVYKSDQPTVRRTISYDEVLRINRFIQDIVNIHNDNLRNENNPYYIIENTAYTTAVFPEYEPKPFSELLKELEL
ncbi:hypothetical protein NBT05_05885 [Aquimarina sp. ERC-38]|uniref:hypothetical protein n=1 Tax=Aquimarina sp. ERC-38 TaxID=2949996 RepID=UPI002246E206|nr:hypothetical protein [Aquimarina sp. ERC-38]UZO81996.1 hypothetical protein NBT05_05885 [Aquimarina sp. ERC-38]